MKDNYIHITFVIDESGSMSGQEDNIVSGFKKVVDEQKENKDGKCTVSFFKFSDNAKEVFTGKDVNDVEYLKASKFLQNTSWPNNCKSTINTLDAMFTELTSKREEDAYIYRPHGMTAMNDGIGKAIDSTGKWLSEMDESERPSKVMVVVMTDGFENNSTDYTITQIKDMIKHQEDVYSWTFVYLGTDITDTKAAEDLGINNTAYMSKKNISDAFNMVNCSANVYRSAKGTTDEINTMYYSALNENLNALTDEYEKELGIKIKTNK